MYRLCLFIVSFLPFILAIEQTDYPYLLPSKLQTRSSAEEQRQAAQKLIDYYKIPASVTEINPNLFQNEKDSFTIKTVEVGDSRKLHVKASSGVAALWGVNYYLKQYVNVHIGWQHRMIHGEFQNLFLPLIEETVIANDRFRYYSNICTHSYSFVWWRETEWTEHIFWMALNGINLFLTPLGTEEIWRDIYLELGLTEDEISEHFAGPAFLAWQRMGNLRGWGGPLPTLSNDHSTTLQHHILKLIVSLGMIPVLPAFAGHAPRALRRVFFNSTFAETDCWNEFSSEYCCPLFVHPSDPLFENISVRFLTKATQRFGDYHIYSADPFNELSTGNLSTEFVTDVANSIYSGINKVDPRGVWLLQNWMFVKDPILWPGDRVRSFLTAVPRGRLLVLDLQSEQWPQYDIYDMYHGQPFIWCMLHNFGGTLGMFGDLRPINSEVYKARNRSNSTMMGVGLTMEGINQNYVVYDLMLESAWRKSPIEDLEAWSAAYAQRRYRCRSNDAARGWRYLLKSVYNYPGVMRMRGKYVVTRKPSFKIVPWAWYTSHDLMEAWKEFVRASFECSNNEFFHDLVDVTRQALQYRAEQLYVKLVQHVKNGNAWSANQTASVFINVMQDMEYILGKNKDFCLYCWLLSARKAAVGDEKAKDINEFNAKNQITLWGPNGEIEDYACKQWSGMFEHYYIPRWKSFLSAAMSVLDREGTLRDWDERGVQEAVREGVTRHFMTAQVLDPGEGGAAEAARMLFRKWYVVPNLEDLARAREDAPRRGAARATFSDTDDDDDVTPTVVLLSSTTSKQ